MCPDRTLAQARKYIAETAGEKYAEGVILDLEKMWEESDKTTPLICFLSMGADPTSNIEALSKKLKLACSALSMGQGQEVHARRLLQQCMTVVSTFLDGRSEGHGGGVEDMVNVVCSHREAGYYCRTATLGWNL